MNRGEQRNTSKEKQLNKKGFPYKNISLNPHYINKQKWVLKDDSEKEYGRFRLRVNALKEQKRLKKEEFKNDIYLERL